MKYVRFFPIVFVLLIWSCKNDKISSEYMAFDKIVIANPSLILDTLCQQNSTIVKTPGLYINNFRIVDSLLFIDTKRENGLMDVVSINSNKLLCSFFNKGKAKYEFQYGVNIALQTTFYHKDSCLLFTIYNPTKAELYEVNVTQSIQNKHPIIQEVDYGMPIPRFAFWAKTLSDSVLLIRYLNEMEIAQNRSLCNKKQSLESPVLNQLNAFEIPMNEDFNIMSSLIAVSQEKQLCAEAPIGMNYINIYSPLSDKGYTLCVDKKMDKLSDILKTSRFNRKYMFADIRAYKFGFAVLVYNISELVFQTEGSYTPSILFFNWDGKPIGRVLSTMKFNHFDLNEDTGELYILNEEKQLLKFELKEIVSQIL